MHLKMDKIIVFNYIFILASSNENTVRYTSVPCLSLVSPLLVRKTRLKVVLDSK